MSWESEIGNVIKHNHWPNPFRNMVKQIDVLACEGTWEAMITMFAIGMGNWAWSNFIPSPFEITRKVFTGSYKCGFYLGPKIKSPLDLVWRDGSGSRALGSILKPATRALFYLWAGQTIYEGLSTWQSLIYEMEFCDWDGNTSTMRDSHAPIATSHSGGAPAFATIMYDPRDRCQDNVTGVEVTEEVVFQCHFLGEFISSGDTLTNCKVGVNVNGEIRGLIDVGTCGPDEVLSFAITVEGHEDFLVTQPYYECDSNRVSVFFSDLHCSRFIVNAWPPSYPIVFPQPLIVPPPPENPLCPYYT